MNQDIKNRGSFLAMMTTFLGMITDLYLDLDNLTVSWSIKIKSFFSYSYSQRSRYSDLFSEVRWHLITNRQQKQIQYPLWCVPHGKWSLSQKIREIHKPVNKSVRTNGFYQTFQTRHFGVIREFLVFWERIYRGWNIAVDSSAH